MAMDSPITNVPTEILVDILNHLDASDLRHAALVCKRWSDIIGKTPKLMQKFVLQIGGYNHHNLSTALKFQRKFVNVNVDSSRHSEYNGNWRKKPSFKDQLVQVFERIGVSVTHFSMNEWELDRHDLTSMFKSMPNLKSIIFSEVAIVERKKGPKSTLHMEKLESLKAAFTAWSLMDIIHAPQLTYLNINGLNNDFDRASFTSFIETATSLRTLIICSPYGYARQCPASPCFDCKNFRVFYETLASMDSMQLRQLESLEIGNFTPSSWNEFCKFVSNRSNTLTELTINLGRHKPPIEAYERIFQVAFGDLKRLNVLEIGSVVKDCPDDVSVFNGVNLNKSIECLSMVDYSCSRRVFERVLSTCRGLTSLEIGYLTPERANFIANNLKLTKLTVKELSYFNVRFPTLEVLQINCVDERNLKNFLKFNGNIRTLIAKRVWSHFQRSLINFIIDKTNVEHVTIETDVPISSDIYEKIAKTPKRLQTLEWIHTKGNRGKDDRRFFKLPISSDLNQFGSGKSKRQRTA